MTRPRAGWVSLLAVVAVLGVSLLAVTARPADQDRASTGDRAADSRPLHDDKRRVSDEQRLDAIARAAVWQAPTVPVARARLGDAGTIRDLPCRFKISELGGTTPKFDCDLPGGEEVRIKYGKGPEIPAEAAATRLLRALGFGADRITLVERLRCFGCPEEPFSMMKAVEITRARPLYERVVNHQDVEQFEWVALERKFDARPIETGTLEGWAFFELDQIDPARGGAPRAHVDALRLMAIFLSHWDNKSENQRLVCLSASWPEGQPCPKPFLLLQDVGATFGPSKVDLDAWARVRMWQDRARCSISMRDLPYDGATFTEARVTEGGRQHLGRLLSQLTDRQLHDLFRGARFDQKRGVFSAPRPAAEWVRVFRDKVRAITDGPPCPEA